MQDTVVITSTPFTDTEIPLMAPGLLKPSAKKAGYNSVAFDLNSLIYNKYKNEPLDVQKKLLNFFLNEEVSIEIIPRVKEYFEYMMNEILKHQPKYVCLSLLSYVTQVSTKYLCMLLKSKSKCKIIVGGAGIFNESLHFDGTSNSNDTWIKNMVNQKLIDHYIVGDGEIALTELLKGNLNYPGINRWSWQQVTDVNEIPFPNYDDYDLQSYSSKTIPIIGSRGCIRHCTFCNIHAHWKKFQWRTAENIFNEMVSQSKKYGINRFKFTDSLINGNLIEFKNLMELIAEYNHNKSDQDRLLWRSFFVFRPKHQFTEKDWELTYKGGCESVIVGVESLVTKVRIAMGKHHDNEDLDFSLRMCKKYRIKVVMMLIVGYITDNDHTHRKTLEWLHTNKHYAGNPISHISLGGTLQIYKNTPLHFNRQKLNINWSPDQQPHDWTSQDGTNNPKQRLEWYNDIKQTCIESGFQLSEAIDNHFILENM